jgi:hypothetical protein
VQVSDRWHLWHGLGQAVRKEVAAHSACWAKGTPLQEGKRAQTTLQRWQQVHDLRGEGAGLLECARRLALSLNTVKRYDRASEPGRLQRVPKYRPTLAGPYRDYLRRRRAEEPGVRSGSSCARSGSAATRAPASWSATSTRAGWTAASRTCHPARPPGSSSPGQTAWPEASRRQSPASRPPAPEMTPLATLIRDFAALLAPGPGQRHAPAGVDHVRPRRGPAPRPCLHPRAGPGHPSRDSGTHLPLHNGRTEGANTKTILWNQNCQIGAAWSSCVAAQGCGDAGVAGQVRMVMARLRRLAITLGPSPVRTWERSSA